MAERGHTLRQELQEQGRGVVAALVVLGASYTYTMEVWWRSWQLPAWHVLVYSVVGLVVVLAIVRSVSFRTGSTEAPGVTGGEETRAGAVWRRVGRTVADFAEVLTQSFVAAYLLLVLFGVLTLDDTPSLAVRLGLTLVVPFGFGAALANEVFTDTRDQNPRTDLWRTLGVFATGAVFLTGPVAPTEELGLIATHAGYWRLAALVVVSVLVSYMALFELEFRGQETRINRRSKWLQIGHAFLVYGIGLAVAAGLLAAFGHLDAQPPVVWIQKLAVLAFPASLGASAAELVV